MAAARVVRKQTNKGRAEKELAKLLQLPSNMLPMLRPLNKKRWLLLRRKLPSQPDKGRAASEDENADTDKNESDEDGSDDDDDTAIS